MPVGNHGKGTPCQGGEWSQESMSAQDPCKNRVWRTVTGVWKCKMHKAELAVPKEPHWAVSGTVTTTEWLHVSEGSSAPYLLTAASVRALN